MADVAFQHSRVTPTGVRQSSSLRYALRRKSTVAFLMTLPLIVLIAVLVELVICGRAVFVIDHERWVQPHLGVRLPAQGGVHGAGKICL